MVMPECPVERGASSAFALSQGRRAKTDRIDAGLIARFMNFRPEAGRRLPSEKLRVPRALTTRRGQIVEMRKRLVAQIGALEQRIADALAQEEALAARADLLRSIPGIGPVSAAMLLSG